MLRSIACGFVFLFFTVFAFSQEKQRYKVLTVAFYNQENLFDTIDDPRKFDEHSPIMELPAENRSEAYRKKLRNMAHVIAQIGKEISKNAPAVIGVCEVENKKVLEDLVNEPALVDKNYGIVHYPSPDERGIDVAFLYQKALFRPISSKAYELVMFEKDDPEDRDYTRDQLLVTGLLDGEKMHFIVNHWPSRSGGAAASSHKREKAAALNKKIIDSIQVVDPYAKIITMGDFNDGPYNASLSEVLDAKAEKEEVGLKGLYNPMYNILKRGIGTIAYRDSWDLFDQIILSAPFLEKDYGSYRLYRARVYNPAYLTTSYGKYKGYPFRSYSNGQFSGGYSDHFPVYVYLIKKDGE